MEMEKIGTFVGILLVGLLMFGLVSGAGYNIVTPSTSSSSSSSSSSGGGSSSGGASTPTYTVTDEQFLQGYLKELSVNSRLKFNVESEIHYVKLLELTSTTAKIEITSDPQEATLVIGDTRRFEVSGDNYYDLSVTLNSINSTSSKAKIIIISISEEVTIETELEEAEKEKEAGKISDDELVDSSPLSRGIKKVTDVVKNLGWKSIAGILVSLSIVGGAVWYFLRDKRKKFVEIKTKEK